MAIVAILVQVATFLSILLGLGGLLIRIGRLCQLIDQTVNDVRQLRGEAHRLTEAFAESRASSAVICDRVDSLERRIDRLEGTSPLPRRVGLG